MMNFLKSIKKIPYLGRFLDRSRISVLRCLPKWLVLRLYRQNFDWEKCEKELQSYYNSDVSGITEQKRNPKVIVSLTSYPARIPRIHYTLISLLKQTVKPDEIVLWLGNEQFPNKENDLPETVLKLQKHGLSIKWTKDIRQYKKLIPALHTYPNDIIVTVDDDMFYSTNLLKILLESYNTNKMMIHGLRGHRIQIDNMTGYPMKYSDWKHSISFDDSPPSFTNMLTGVGGILYPPGSLHQDVLREGIFMERVPTNDDIWFWAMAVLNETSICVVKNNTAKAMPNKPLEYEDIFEMDGLCTVNVGQGQNDVQLKQVLDYYPLLTQRLGFTESQRVA